ncbi:MAG: serine hydrolase [Proteobacteria bacterium]|nr:serine hydrolase [Pseudomonadota bacterium]
MNQKLLLFVVGLLFSICTFAAAPDSVASVLRKIDSIAKSTRSNVSVTAIHIENHKKISYNGSTPCFMASTVKIPIAITFLDKVDRNQGSLEDIMRLSAKDSVPGSGGLYYLLRKKELDISLRHLIKHMLVTSDNSASDAVLRKVNGPQAVLEKMHALGFEHTFVNRSILETFVDTHDGDHALLYQPHTSDSLEKTLNRIPLSRKTEAWKRFENDIRDTTTSDDMALLLDKLYEGEILSRSSTNFLINTMEQCKTGRRRLKGLLPPRTEVAHKTGTWSIFSGGLKYPVTKQLYRFASDVGIITLPNNKGHVAIAVYVKSRSASGMDRSRVIAAVSRVMYDYFLHDKTVVVQKAQKKSLVKLPKKDPNEVSNGMCQLGEPCDLFNNSDLNKTLGIPG